MAASKMSLGLLGPLVLLLAARAAGVTRPPSALQKGMARIAAANAEQLALREERELIGADTGGVKDLIRCAKGKLAEAPAQIGGYLERQGAMSVVNVLSQPTAEDLLAFINGERVRAEEEVRADKADFEARFGGVNCRGPGQFGLRQDLYLPVREPIVRAALGECFESLMPLLEATVGGKDATLHEISSLVADPGAPRQCVHADTIVLPCPQYPDASMAPLYTFFVALQDVEEGMGHTVFLPTTHTPDAHLLWNRGRKHQESFIKVHRAVQSKLTLGDCSVFDSRVLHCGRANTSRKRRVLFYFTLSAQKDWPLPNGLHGSNSIRAEDRGAWTVGDVLAAAQ